MNDTKIRTKPTETKMIRVVLTESLSFSIGATVAAEVTAAVEVVS
jgi:hypothetical protein